MLYRSETKRDILKAILQVIINSFLAGLMIGIGGLTYLSLENKSIGAFLFSLGLITILLKKYSLYTGKAHGLLEVKNIWNILSFVLVLIGNFIGSYVFMGKAVGSFLNISTNALWAKKLSYAPIQVIFLSFLCGALMYLAVTLWKKTENPLVVVMPIMVFILTGCEHCVANMFYAGVAGNIAESWKFLLINIAGNTLGSIVMCLLEKFKDN